MSVSVEQPLSLIFIFYHVDVVRRLVLVSFELRYLVRGCRLTHATHSSVSTTSAADSDVDNPIQKRLVNSCRTALNLSQTVHSNVETVTLKPVRETNSGVVDSRTNFQKNIGTLVSNWLVVLGRMLSAKHLAPSVALRTVTIRFYLIKNDLFFRNFGTRITTQ